MRLESALEQAERRFVAFEIVWQGGHGPFRGLEAPFALRGEDRQFLGGRQLESKSVSERLGKPPLGSIFHLTVAPSGPIVHKALWAVVNQSCGQHTRESCGTPPS